METQKHTENTSITLSQHERATARSLSMYMTVKDIREKTADLPDDTEILVKVDATDPDLDGVLLTTETRIDTERFRHHNQTYLVITPEAELAVKS